MSSLYVCHLVMRIKIYSSLKQQSVDRHVVPLRHIILIPSEFINFLIFMKGQ